jgi:hypothetical protein
LKFPPGKVSTNEASSNELTPSHIEMSFASGLCSLKHFCLLLAVIFGAARKLPGEHTRASGEVFLIHHHAKAARKNPVALAYRASRPARVPRRAVPNGMALLHGATLESMERLPYGNQERAALD